MSNYPFISLEVKKILQLEDIKTWYRIVNTFLPSGLISTIQNAELENGNEPIYLIKEYNKDTKKFIYKVPLTRDLLDNETDSIVVNYGDIIEDEFSYEIKATTLLDPVHKKIIKDVPVMKIAKNIARYIHDRDMKEMIQDGWTYGSEDNYKMKISSELLPFEELPEDIQNIDPKLIERIIKEFDNEGYVLIKKEKKED